MSHSIRTDRTLLRPEARSRRYVLAPLTAPDAPRREGRPALDLALVLDRSGSMQGRKLELARQAAVDAIGRLAPADRFSVVVYDDRVDVLAAARSATPAARFEAEALLAQVEARSTTDLTGGWLAGCETLVEDRRSGPARCLLLTDGLANRGVVDPQEILALGTEMRRRGVSTSTFGVGEDFDEALLGGLAESAGGHFYFIERTDQIPAFLSGEVDEALDVAVRDARLVVEGPAGLHVRSLNEHPVESRRGVSRVFLGDLVSGQEVAPALELRFPRRRAGASVTVTLRWEDAEGVLDGAPHALRWRVASHAENDAQPRDRVVDRAVAELFAARTRRRAHLLNRAGRGDQAADEMRRCAARILAYAGDDEALREIAAGLEREAGEFAARLDALSLKRRYFSSLAAMKQRSDVGRARRSTARPRRDEPVVVLPTTRPLHRLAEEAVAALAAVPDGFDPPAAVGPSLQIQGRRDSQTLDAAKETDLTDRAVAAAPGLRVVLTTRRLDDNRFSHWHPDVRVAVVSLHDWHDLSALPPVAFVAHEVALHGLRCHPGYDPELLFHEETRGCFFDFCRAKGAIDARLASGGLCVACRHGLEAAGVPVDRVEALGAVIRALAEPGAAAAS